MDHVRVDNTTDNPVPVTVVSGGGGGGGDGAILDGASSAIKATVLDLTNANPLTVAMVDSAGTQVSSFGGGTQYADAAARGTATGTLAMGDDGTNIQSVKVDTNGVLAIQDNGGSITVDGTFWQATQPVSGTVTANAGTGPFPVSDNAGSLSVDWNGTQPVTGNGTAAGALRVALPTDGTGVVGLIAGTARIGSVRPVDSADADLTAAKLTQTARFLGVQSSVDAGRTNLQFYATGVAAGTTGTETAISLTRASDTSATSAAVSWVITNGKRFRITAISYASRGHATATAQVTTFNFRINVAGAVTTTSTPIVLAARTATPATSSAWDRITVPIGNGIEFTGNGTIQFGVTANAVYTTNAPTWDVLITGFEY